jgi:hypothetical protein
MPSGDRFRRATLLGSIMTSEPEMMIRVVEKSGQAPTVDDEGKEVWYGGYGDPSQEEASLSASILTASAPDLEIGTWYTLSDFEQKITGIREDADAGWTIIAIDEIGVEIATPASILVPQITAAKTICGSIIDHFKKLGKQQDLWIRVE